MSHGRPVCGEDGKTYSNECELKRAGCLTGEDIAVVYQGECRQDPVCSRTQFRCLQERNCISYLSVCDRVSDCGDGSDESNCDSNCSSGQFR